MSLPTIPLAINGHILQVEIAATPAARRCGLSHRDNLDTNQGMLFVYKQDQRRYFWMKDTVIPLSIIFINANYIVLQHQDMIPLATKTVSSDKLVRYALEANRGWFANNAIKTGDKVEFKLPANLQIR